MMPVAAAIAALAAVLMSMPVVVAPEILMPVTGIPTLPMRTPVPFASSMSRPKPAPPPVLFTMMPEEAAPVTTTLAPVVVAVSLMPVVGAE